MSIKLSNKYKIGPSQINCTTGKESFSTDKLKEGRKMKVNVNTICGYEPVTMDIFPRAEISSMSKTLSHSSVPLS